jgi:hypothetical protein
MTGHLKPSNVAWFGLPLVVAAILAIINTTSQGFLWEGPNSRSNRITADSTTIASDAARVASDAAQKDAVNKLEAALEAAKAVIEASRLQAESNIRASENLSRSTENAAARNAEGMFKAAEEASKAQNAEYGQITKRFIGDPVEKVDALNNQIVRLRNELESGRDSITGHPLSWEERINRQFKLENLQFEHKIQSDITSKNWQDALGMVTGATNGLLGNIRGLYPTGNEPKPERRIVQEP